MKLLKSPKIIEILIVACCIAMLLLSSTIANHIGKERAKELKCMSNLAQWGQALQAYTADNNGSFGEEWIGQQTLFEPEKYVWFLTLGDYIGDPFITFCPNARIPYNDFPNPEGQYDWDISITWEAWWATDKHPIWDQEPFNSTPHSSYCINGWASNPRCGWKPNNYWRTIHQPNASEIPMMTESFSWIINPIDESVPPEYEGQTDADGIWEGLGGTSLHRIHTPRHEGAQNILYMDGSVRTVGLKGIWFQKWSRDYDPEQARTNLKAQLGTTPGGDINWPEWMADFVEY